VAADGYRLPQMEEIQMANAVVPVKFQIFRGDQVVREEVLTEAVIKIGKLASSHLRLDDESVSRMHAVLEVNGPDEVQLIDLGSTRGTLLNGERIAKTSIKSGDQVQFGDVRVAITFLAEGAEAPTPAPVMPAAPPPAVAPPQYAAPVRPSAPATVAYGAPAQYSAPPPQAMVAPQGYAAAGAGMGSFASHAGAEVEVHDGTHAIEVQALYRGVVIQTRHLSDPTGRSTEGQSKTMLLAGGALIVVALVVFFATILDIGAEKSRYDKYVADGGESKNFQWKGRSPAMDFLVFGGIGVGIALCYMGLKRRGRTNPNFVIGAAAGADAPLGTDFIGGQSFSLVSTTGADFLVNVTPAMTGEVLLDNQVVPLPQFVQQRGASFSLGDRGRAKIDCGETSFLVSATPKPRTFPVPFLVWRWSEQAYTVGTAVGLLLFLLMIFSVPPDPKSLSLDLFNADSRFVNFLIKPPEEKEEEIPEWLKKKGPDEQGGKGKRHKGEEGKMGKKTSKNKEGLYGLKGPKDNPDPHLAKKLAEEQAKNAGILGVLKMAEGSHLASIFGRDTAAGNDAECWAASSAIRSVKPTAWAVLAWLALGQVVEVPVKEPSASATSVPSARVVAAVRARATAAARVVWVAGALVRQTSSRARPTCAGRWTRKSSAVSSVATSTR
jgi:hypothetical protein